MRARRGKFEQRSYLLAQYQGERGKVLGADYSAWSNSRNSIIHRPDPSPTKSCIKAEIHSPKNPSKHTSARPEDAISQYQSPIFGVRGGRHWHPAGVQPRQRSTQIRAITPPVDLVANSDVSLQSLSSLASDLRSAFSQIPPLSHNHRKLSHSVQYDSPEDLNSSLRSRLNKKRLHHYEPGHLSHRGAAHTPTNLHKKEPLPHTRRKRSIAKSCLSARPEVHSFPRVPDQSAGNLENLQQYFLQFHRKSRELLGRLERSVLGQRK